MTYEDRWPRHHQCPNRAKVEVNGKFYCGRHDPVAVAKRDEEKRARWKAASEYNNAVWVRRGLEAKYCKGLTDDELRAGIKE